MDTDFLTRLCGSSRRIQMLEMTEIILLSDLMMSFMS